MLIEIKVPSMGESISEVTIGKLLKTEGAYVETDEEIVELETDKVNQVLYAQGAGQISWEAAPESVVKIGQVIGKIDTDKKAVKTMPIPTVTPVAEKPAKTPASTVTEKPVKTEAGMDRPVLSPATPQPIIKGSTRATKDRFLEELSTPLLQSKSEVPESLKSDISLAKQKPQSSEPLSTPLMEMRETREKMSKIRKVIATRLVDALQQTAMLTSFNEVDMTKINALRESYKETFLKQHNVRLGFMPFFIKAAVSAMKAFPQINSYIDGDELVYRNYFDVGIAVATDRGLVVPVVRNCDVLSFADIERSIESFAKKAREGGLIPSDLMGGGFTITNGGTYGSLFSTPIINPPQCAILGMHKIMKRPVVVDDEIVIRSMMYVALSYDHRIIDGKEAVSFLVHIKNVLEDPSRLVIGV